MITKVPDSVVTGTLDHVSKDPSAKAMAKGAAQKAVDGGALQSDAAKNATQFAMNAGVSKATGGMITKVPDSVVTGALDHVAKDPSAKAMTKDAAQKAASGAAQKAVDGG